MGRAGAQAGRAGRWGAGAGQVLGAGWARAERAGGELGVQAGCWARRRGAGRAGGRRGSAAGRAGGRQWRAGRAQQRRGRSAAWALGTRPGCAGWPWAVHSVHSAHFRSVLTRFFFLSHQMNTVHCKIKFFRKKIIFIKFK